MDIPAGIREGNEDVNAVFKQDSVTVVAQTRVVAVEKETDGQT